MNPLTYFIGNQQKDQSGCGLVLGQNLGQIMSNTMKKVRKRVVSIFLFHILHGEYLFKGKVVVIQNLNESLKQYSYINESYVPTLLFWMGGSHLERGQLVHLNPSWNLLFCDNPGLNVRYLWTFQVENTFYKLDVKFLAAKNEIRYLHMCVALTHHHHSFRSVSTKALIILALVKEVSGKSLKINEICR